MDDIHGFEIKFFSFGLAVIALVVGAIFLPYLSPLLIAATFAIIFEPLHRKFMAIFHVGLGLGAFLVVLAIIIIVLVPLSLFAVRVVAEGFNLYTAVADSGTGVLSGRVAEFIRTRLPFIDFGAVMANAGTLLGRVVGWFFSNIGAVFSGLTVFFANTFIALIAFYYFLKDGKRIRAVLLNLMPLSEHYKNEIAEKLVLAVNSVVRGSLVVAIIQGAMATVGFFVFGIPSAAFWGSLTVVAALIPVVGTMVIVVPAVAYLVIIGNFFPAFGLALWGIVFVGLIDNLTRPQILKRGVNIHPLAVLLSVLGGLKFFGPVGFILGPVAVSLLFALLEIYPHIVLGKKDHVENR
ncbi:MAG: AI-2E family transporter [Patescibacteria group bacterium]